MGTITRSLRLLALLAAALMIAAVPALAEEHEEEEEGGSTGVTCEPSTPSPGEEMTCTAEGLEPGSAFQWEANFLDGTEEAGEGTASLDESGMFIVEVPETPANGYQVSVTGTAADGEEYDESTEGIVGPFGGGDDDDSENGDEEEGGDPEEGDDEDGFGDDDGQVSPAPDGAVAAGLGGAATNGQGSLFAVVAALIALTVGAGLARESRRLRIRSQR